MPNYDDKKEEISTENSAYEAHKMLGQSTHKVPVNVGKNSVSHGISIYRVNAGSSHNPNDIKIYVHGNNGVNYGHTGDGTYKDYYQISQANKGTDNTPQKFAKMDVTEIEKLFVEPQFQSNGIGKMLLDYVVKNKNIDKPLLCERA